jgi:hypothetical protein
MIFFMAGLWGWVLVVWKLMRRLKIKRFAPLRKGKNQCYEIFTQRLRMGLFTTASRAVRENG